MSPSSQTSSSAQVSLNHNLAGGRVRFRFADTPLLPGVTVHESWGQVGELLLLVQMMRVDHFQSRISVL